MDHKKPMTTIVIKPERTGWKDALMTAWLLMWTVIGVYVLYELIAVNHTRDEKITLIIFFSFWFYFEWRVLKAFLWIKFGQENIKIDKEYVWIKRSIGKYGKSKNYLIENIKDIAIRKPNPRSFAQQFENSYWVVGGEKINFDYFTKTIHFGRKLDDTDAKLLAKVFHKRIEKYKQLSLKSGQ